MKGNAQARKLASTGPPQPGDGIVLVLVVVLGNPHRASITELLKGRSAEYRKKIRALARLSTGDLVRFFISVSAPPCFRD